MCPVRKYDSRFKERTTAVSVWNTKNAVVMELADMQDLGSCAFGVWVQVPPTAVTPCKTDVLQGVLFMRGICQAEGRCFYELRFIFRS